MNHYFVGPLHVPHFQKMPAIHQFAKGLLKPDQSFDIVVRYLPMIVIRTLVDQIRPNFDGSLKALPDSGGHCNGARLSSWSSLE